MRKSKLIIGLLLIVLIIWGISYGIHRRNAMLTQATQTSDSSISDEDITTYLKKSNFADTNYDGEVFTAFHKYSEVKSNSQTTIYLWLVAQEYYLKDGDLQRGAGTSLPLALYFDNDKLISINAPRDGADYTNDVKTIFPESIQNEILDTSDTHNTMVASLTDQARIEAQSFYGKAVAAAPTTKGSKQCVTCMTLSDNGKTITITETTRVTLQLPEEGYDINTLTITPSDLIGQTFGASSDPGNWVKTYEGVKPGTAIISVPAKSPNYKDFTLTVIIETI